MGVAPSFDPKQLRAMGFVWEVLAAMVIPLIFFALFGRWLDAKLGTSPWFLVAGFPCGLFLAYRIIRRKADRLKREVYPGTKKPY